MLNKAVRWRRIEQHPLRGSSPPPERASKPPEFYTHEQLEALYAAAGPYEQVWRFMANTGLRRNEALYLALSDVLSDRVIVRSTEDRPTKSRQWREVRLNTPARAAVEALRAARGEDDHAYLLPRIAPRSLSRAYDKAIAKAGLPGSLHTLRHTFISHIVMAGVDLPTVQKMAGHASISTTLKYSHLAPGHAQAAVDRIAL
jgi:integrase